MWSGCFIAWKEVDNGWASIQSWKKPSIRKSTFLNAQVLSAHIVLFGHVLTNKGRNRGADA